jgi:hypothetical protein
MSLLYLFVVGLFGCCAAWGPDGHTIVAHIADYLVSPEVANVIRSDLYNVSLSNASGWCDNYRKIDVGRWSASLHYINYQGKACKFDWGTDCKNDWCNAGAIVNYTKQVFDRSTSTDDRFFALKFVIHMVGDIHQPLHVSSADNLGGNAIKLGRPVFSKTFEPSAGSNLHSVWDTTLLVEEINELGSKAEQADQMLSGPPPYHNWQVLADLLEKRMDAEWGPKKEEWRKTVAGSRDEVTLRAGLSTVAQESAELGCEYAYNYANGSAVQEGDVLQRDYYLRARPIVEQQLAKGGARLAQLLEEALAQARAKDALVVV